MKLSRIGTLAIFMIAGAAVFQNCAPPSHRISNDAAPIELQSLEKLEDELKTLAGSDLTCVASADCQMIDVGVAPCGGADYQLLVSIKSVQYRSVLSLAEEYSHQDKLQTRPDTVGTCVISTPYVARCVAHSCVAESS